MKQHILARIVKSLWLYSTLSIAKSNKHQEDIDLEGEGALVWGVEGDLEEEENELPFLFQKYIFNFCLS